MFPRIPNIIIVLEKIYATIILHIERRQFNIFNICLLTDWVMMLGDQLHMAVCFWYLDLSSIHLHFYYIPEQCLLCQVIRGGYKRVHRGICTPWPFQGVLVHPLAVPESSGAPPGRSRECWYTPWPFQGVLVHPLAVPGSAGAPPGRSRECWCTPWRSGIKSLPIEILNSFQYNLITRPTILHHHACIWPNVCIRPSRLYQEYNFCSTKYLEILVSLYRTYCFFLVQLKTRFPHSENCLAPLNMRYSRFCLTQKDVKYLVYQW